MSTLRVLLIDDDEDDVFLTRSLLARMQVVDCDLDWVAAYDEGLAALLTGRYDACLVDRRLGVRSGLALLREAKGRGCRTPVILLTGQADLAIGVEALEAGAADYLNKNEIDPPLLERVLRYARERKRAEARIRKQSALLDRARDAFIAYDLEGRVTYWNKSAERLTGWSEEEMLGEQARERLYDAAQQQKLADCWSIVMDRGEWKGELRLSTKTGEKIVVESRWTLVYSNDGSPESVLVINTDITEHKRLESRFLRSQRMESIGRLVSGIAHDLGNLLVPISLGVRVLQQHFGDDETARRTLSMIQSSTERGSHMVDQVLAFARGVQGERVVLQPKILLEDVQNVVEETFPDSISVDVRVDDALREIAGDATQIQQVLMNLCVNARDAMSEGGRLSICATTTLLEENDARARIDAEPGEYVRIAISDTGVGIPETVVDKIFEPFFSTKSGDQGTGLGLSTAYSIVKGHGGFIDVESEEGVGTTFSVYLPVSGTEVSQRPDDTSAVCHDEEGAQVLVVHEEDSNLHTTRHALEQAGYRVQAVRGGGEALRVLQSGEVEVDIVLADLALPDTDGLAVVEQMRTARPDVPIIAAGGHVEPFPQAVLDAGAQMCLPEPVTPEEVRTALRDVLRSTGEAPVPSP